MELGLRTFAETRRLTGIAVAPGGRSGIVWLSVIRCFATLRDGCGTRICPNTQRNRYCNTADKLLRRQADELGELPLRMADVPVRAFAKHILEGVDVDRAFPENIEGVRSASPAAREPTPAAAPGAASVAPGAAPAPASAPPEPTVMAPAEPAVPDVPVVSKQTEDAVLALATTVWSAGGKPRYQLFQPGLNQALAEEFLAHALAKQWVRINGEMVVPGSVNPRPMEPIVGERSGVRWLSR